MVVMRANTEKATQKMRHDFVAELIVMMISTYLVSLIGTPRMEFWYLMGGLVRLVWLFGIREVHLDFSVTLTLVSELKPKITPVGLYRGYVLQDPHTDLQCEAYEDEFHFTFREGGKSVQVQQIRKLRGYKILLGQID